MSSGDSLVDWILAPIRDKRDPEPCLHCGRELCLEDHDSVIERFWDWILAVFMPTLGRLDQ